MNQISCLSIVPPAEILNLNTGRLETPLCLFDLHLRPAVCQKER